MRKFILEFIPLTTLMVCINTLCTSGAPRTVPKETIRNNDILVMDEVTLEMAETPVQKAVKAAPVVVEEPPKEEIAVASVPVEEVEEPEIGVTEEEIELIAMVTMAEAEAEPELGQRLVIDTILNRVDGEHWPDTIEEVIYQPNQYTCMWNGRLDRCEVKDDICQLVREEVVNRTNSEVVFFRTQRYSDYGTPMFKVCCHYFSKY